MFSNFDNNNSLRHALSSIYSTEHRFFNNNNIRIALVIVLAFLNIEVISQTCDTLSKYFPGAVILRTEKKKDAPGFILQGCIKLMNSQEMIVAPKLVDSLGKTDRFFGRDALAYWYIRDNDTVYYLNGGRYIRQFRWVYLERIVKGPMELYYFMLRGSSLSTLSITEYTYYYFRKDGKWLSKKAIVHNEGGKRKLLKQIFKDCTPALELISKTSNSQLHTILPTLVTLYNSIYYSLN